MECPKCGFHNPDGIERCKICGAAPEKPKGLAGPARRCPFCGAENDKEAPFCSACNKPLYTLEGKVEKPEKAKPEKYYDRTYADYPSSAARTWRAGLGGILIIMTAFFALIDVLFSLFVFWEISNLADYDRLVRQNPQLEGLLASVVVCESVRIMFIVIAFMGGVFAVQRLRWGLAMLGGIFGALSLMSSFLALALPYWALIVLILFIGSIIGVVLIGSSRREFMLA